MFRVFSLSRTKREPKPARTSHLQHIRFDTDLGSIHGALQARDAPADNACVSSITSSASLGHRRRGLTCPGLRLAAPLVVVGGFLALLLAVQLGAYHGHVAGLVTFGHHQIADTHPPAGTPIVSPDGYDGQLYWIQAHDPLLLYRATIAHLAHAYPGYFLQRPAYPALAFLLSGGQASALPWSMLAINVICLLGLTAAVSRWAVAHGRSAWWGAVIGLTPGLLMPMLRDLSDVLAVTTMLGGLLAWRLNRRWTAAGLLSIAVLAREPMTLAVVAITVEVLAQGWSARHEPGTVRRAVRRSWPTIVMPTLAFAGWQIYIHIAVQQAGIGAAQLGASPVPSLAGYAGELHTIFAAPLSAYSLWDLVYLGMMAIASIIAFVRLRQGITAPAVAAVLFAAVLMVIVFGDPWGETRYSAPLFGALLLSGLERRSRPLVALCSAVAGMGVLAPLFIPGL